MSMLWRMVCGKCGQASGTDARFCANCGVALSHAQISKERHESGAARSLLMALGVVAAMAFLVIFAVHLFTSNGASDTESAHSVDNLQSVTLKAGFPLR